MSTDALIYYLPYRPFAYRVHSTFTQHPTAFDSIRFQRSICLHCALHAQGVPGERGIHHLTRGTGTLTTPYPLPRPRLANAQPMLRVIFWKLIALSLLGCRPSSIGWPSRRSRPLSVIPGAVLCLIRLCPSLNSRGRSSTKAPGVGSSSCCRLRHCRSAFES